MCVVWATTGDEYLTLGEIDASSLGPGSLIGRSRNEPRVSRRPGGKREAFLAAVEEVREVLVAGAEEAEDIGTLPGAIHSAHLILHDRKSNDG